MNSLCTNREIVDTTPKAYIRLVLCGAEHNGVHNVLYKACTPVRRRSTESLGTGGPSLSKVPFKRTPDVRMKTADPTKNPLKFVYDRKDMHKRI